MHRCWHTQRWVIVQFGSYGALAELPVDKPINHSVLSLFLNYYSKLSSAKINLKCFLHRFIPGPSGEMGAVAGLCAQICRPAELFFSSNFNMEKWTLFYNSVVCFPCHSVSPAKLRVSPQDYHQPSVWDSFLDHCSIWYQIHTWYGSWFALFKEVPKDWLTHVKTF